MSDGALEQDMGTELPWMDDSNFPTRPEGSSHGYRRGFRRRSPLTTCNCRELQEALQGDKWQKISLAWTPERSRLLPPIEFPSLYEACKARAFTAARNLLLFAALTTALTVSGMIFFLFDVDWSKLPIKTQAILFISLATVLGIFALHFYDFCNARKFSSKYRANQIVAERYGYWLFSQNGTWRYAIPLCLVLVWILEIYTPGISSLQAAGLVKEAVRNGEWWRLITGPFLHANLQHVTGNALMLYLCVWQVDSIATRGTALFLVVSGFLVGGIFSVMFEPVDSVGASGGVFALLGFLLVFGWQYRTVLPPKFAYGFLFSIGITFVYGFLLPRIDNAAHLGGLLAGAAIGYLVTGRQKAVYSAYLPALGRVSAWLFFLGFGLVFGRHWYLGAGI